MLLGSTLHARAMKGDIQQWVMPSSARQTQGKRCQVVGSWQLSSVSTVTSWSQGHGGLSRTPYRSRSVERNWGGQGEIPAGE